MHYVNNVLLSPPGEALAASQYVLALVGAGLSAPSGIPTFRGDGSTWRTHNSPLHRTWINIIRFDARIASIHHIHA